jgi:NAD(P)H-dependent FMN reductase
VYVGARHQRGSHMVKIAVVLGSTRPGRNGQAVASWAYDIASKRGDADFELVDIADYGLPLLDEPVPPAMGQYGNPHTKRWAAKIAEFDGYVFVTPEYNHSTSGVLKNAIDFLYAEWNNKAMGVVSYGVAGGTRAAEHLRLIAGELQMAAVRTSVALSLFTDFVDFAELHPGPHQEHALDTLFGEVVAWTEALAHLRHAPQVA